MKVYLETLGCQMNRLDSELVAGLLAGAGHEMTADLRSADVVLYNTCSVRRLAEEKVHSRLGHIAAMMRRAAGGAETSFRPIVGVLGCMAQRAGDTLRKRHPHVSIICAPGKLAMLAEMISAAAAGQTAVALDPDRKDGPARPADGPGDSDPWACDALDPARKTHPGVDPDDDIDAMDMARDESRAPSPGQAYVRVMRGCDNFCSYCIVPFVRGPEVSRRPDRVVEEVRRLAEAGRSTITLLGQAVNRYRWQGGPATVRFSDLLERLSGVPGVRRLRFVTSHPVDFGDDILEVMAASANICPYIHCPAQSGSDAVLKAMNRGYTRRQYDDLVDRARSIVPDVVLASDFIVGFAGETEADHQASAELIIRSRFRNSFIFKYSPRPPAAAAKTLEDNVPEEVKKRRNNELLAVQGEVSLAHNTDYIARTVEVLVEGPSRRVDKQAEKPTAQAMQLRARTRGDHIVVFEGPAELAGRYVNVEITGATAVTLFGCRVETA